MFLSEDFSFDRAKIVIFVLAFDPLVRDGLEWIFRCFPENLDPGSSDGRRCCVSMSAIERRGCLRD